jgi:poly(3-hydroxybutyrate) depolymerase
MSGRYLLIILLGLGAGQQLPAESPDLDGAVRSFLAAEDGAAREAAAARVLALEPDPAELEACLARGWTYPEDEPRGWVVDTHVASDGKARPYHLFVPESYDPAEPSPLLVNLHGGVSRPEVIPEEGFREYRAARWHQGAKSQGYLLVLPLGQAGAEWWSPVGASQVLGIIQQIELTYNVDENRVFCTGFSDGGSGAFCFALNHTTPFAGFLPLNGHVAVAGMGGHQIYLPNLSNKPLHVVNTGRDQLYPAAEVTPFIDAMRAAGAERLTYHVFPDVGHSPEYFPKERPHLLRFLRETVREPHPHSLTWECADPTVGRCHWVVIEELGDVDNDAEALAVDFNPPVASQRVRLGVYIDRAFTGTGVRIEKLAEGETLAASMGLQAGDVITAVDDTDVASFTDLRGCLEAKQPGDQVKVQVQRGEETVVEEGYFAKPEPRPVLAREAPSGRIQVQVEGNRIDVQVRHVARYSLYLSRDLVDLDQPVEVVTNGEVSYQGLVEPDIAFTLAQAGRDQDRTMLYAAKVTVELRP